MTRPTLSGRVICKMALLGAAGILFASCRGEVKGGKFDGQAALGYAKAQLDFGPRIPGSAGAQRAGDWIIAQMKQRADTVIVQSWTHTTLDGKQLPMRNIIARYNVKATDRILYVTH